MAIHLDRKSRTAVMSATALVLAGPVFLIGKYAAVKLQEHSQHPPHSDAHELVGLPGGFTVEVAPGSNGRALVDWLKLDTAGDKALRVQEDSFVAGSATPTPNGWERLADLTQVMKAYRDLTLVIVYEPNSAQAGPQGVELERARLFENRLLKSGISEKRVAILPRQDSGPDDNSANRGLEIVITRRA